jgi:putative PIN family toxin of toxin-antitoxin system
VRAVLDANILIAALLSSGGPPAQIVSRWLAGDFELVVSEALLAELARALAYPKVRARIPATPAHELVVLLRQSAVVAPDPAEPARRSADPGDDYLRALGARERAVLVSGDRHLRELADELPVRTARAFLETLEQTR